jgi:large-conductance mechanosensitive channel
MVVDRAVDMVVGMAVVEVVYSFEEVDIVDPCLDYVGVDCSYFGEVGIVGPC